MIRRCDERDFEMVWTIINDGAQAYKDTIPADRWTEPYMSKEKLKHEIDNGVVFWGCEDAGVLVGVMGIQQVDDVTLVRHAYVRTNSQKRGIGGRLLSHLVELVSGPMLIGRQMRRGRSAFMSGTAFGWSVPTRKIGFSNGIGLFPNARLKRPLCWRTRGGGNSELEFDAFVTLTISVTWRYRDD